MTTKSVWIGECARLAGLGEHPQIPGRVAMGQLEWGASTADSEPMQASRWVNTVQGVRWPWRRSRSPRGT